tara:strand:+ start:2839 stop:3084 length:246 start_codon:yes stop_codon:yes gene_type:complete
MYGCPNCNNVFEPIVYKTVATEPFIRCPECGLSRSLNADLWDKNASKPEPKVENIADKGVAATAKKAKAKAKPKAKKSKKK